MNIPLAEIFKDTTPRKIGKGQILIYEGDSITNLYYLSTGYVKVYNIINAGSERIIFVYGPEDMFPVTSVLSGANVARYFYEAMTDLEVSTIPVESFRNKIKNNLDSAERLFDYTNYVSQQFLQRIDMLSVNDAERKIVALLAFLVVKVGTPQPMSLLRLPLIQQDIADMCGLTRETASIQLAKLSRDKVIMTNKSFVVDTVKLKKLKEKLSITL